MMLVWPAAEMKRVRTAPKGAVLRRLVNRPSRTWEGGYGTQRSIMVSHGGPAGQRGRIRANRSTLANVIEPQDEATARLIGVIAVSATRLAATDQ